MKHHCQTCLAEWGGFRAEHCRVCHQTFSGTSTGDTHRVGDHGTLLLPLGRRCLTPAEMDARGMVLNRNKIWTSGGENPWAATTGERIDLSGHPIRTAPCTCIDGDVPGVDDTTCPVHRTYQEA